jgi:hypothetical protein
MKKLSRREFLNVAFTTSVAMVVGLKPVEEPEEITYEDPKKAAEEILGEYVLYGDNYREVERNQFMYTTFYVENFPIIRRDESLAFARPIFNHETVILNHKGYLQNGDLARIGWCQCHQCWIVSRHDKGRWTEHPEQFTVRHWVGGSRYASNSS